MDQATARVGVLMGGLSAERDISIKTGHGVAGALRERGWNVIELLIGRNADETIRRSHINVAWIALHGKFGEDGCIQGLLEMMGLPYTGSGVQASAIAMDKVRAKQVLADVRDIYLAKDEVCRTDHHDNLDHLGFPVVVKPLNTGSTIGISIAHNVDERKAAINHALRYGDRVLVEEFIRGDEITVPVLNGQVLPVVRILPKDDNKLFDFKAKYNKGEATFECPAKISAEAEHRARSAALNAYTALNCRGLARADFVVRELNDIPMFLEINTIPGMTPTSLSPLSAAVTGMSYAELCEAILLSATCEKEELPPQHP